MSKEEEGFPITALREIKILRKMDHPNISSMKDIVCSQAQDPRTQKGEVYLVFDYMDHDLQGLMSQKINYGPAEIKCLVH